MKADPQLEKLFRSAEQELRATARKYGFNIRLIDDMKGTWYFYPEVENPIIQEDTHHALEMKEF